MIRIVKNQRAVTIFTMETRVRVLCACLLLPPCFPAPDADLFGDVLLPCSCAKRGGSECGAAFDFQW